MPEITTTKNGDAAPAAPVSITLEERILLSYLTVLIGERAVQALAQKVEEVRAKWRVLVSGKKTTEDLKDLGDDGTKAWGAWNTFLHNRLQVARGGVELSELNERIVDLNRVLVNAKKGEAPVETIDTATLFDRVAKLEANEARLAKLEAIVLKYEPDAEPVGSGG